MNPDPDYQSYLLQWSNVYHELNYDRGLSSYFLRKSHYWAERDFTDAHHFSKVLEVGAGTGAHLSYVRHRYDEYVMTDSHPEMLGRIVAERQWPGKVRVQKQDATCLDYPDQQFDRLIATHVLEHLERPHEVLREWCRVVRPGGIISILLPCDPGMAWRLGRAIGSRPKFKKAGLDYDYWMAREHINPINSLVSLIQYYFDDHSERVASHAHTVDGLKSVLCLSRKNLAHDDLGSNSPKYPKCIDCIFDHFFCGYGPDFLEDRGAKDGEFRAEWLLEPGACHPFPQFYFWRSHLLCGYVILAHATEQATLGQIIYLDHLPSLPTGNFCRHHSFCKSTFDSRLARWCLRAARYCIDLDMMKYFICTAIGNIASGLWFIQPISKISRQLREVVFADRNSVFISKGVILDNRRPELIYIGEDVGLTQKVSVLCHSYSSRLQSELFFTQEKVARAERGVFIGLGPVIPSWCSPRRRLLHWRGQSCRAQHPAGCVSRRKPMQGPAQFTQ